MLVCLCTCKGGCLPAALFDACLIRNKEVLELLGNYMGVGSIGMASFADIKKPVEDLVDAEIARKEFECRLLEGLMPATTKAPVVEPTKDSASTSQDPSGGFVTFVRLFLSGVLNTSY